jgi:hypothetical protein
LQPDLIDSYCGPADLKERVDAEPLRSYEDLANAAADIGARADRDALRADALGLETASRWFAGERIPHVELVRRVHQVEAALVPEDEFAAAHERLDDALSGNGSVHERYVAWRESQTVPPELVGAGLERLAAELRGLTDDLFGLPDDHVDFVLETGKPWGGNCDYLGGGRTRISVSMDVGIPSYRLFELVTHEVYPGHHTEAVSKEPLIAKGRLELAIALFPTPRSVVAEGIASLAHEILFGGEADSAGAEILRPVGIPYDAKTAKVVRSVLETLANVGPNLVQMIATGTVRRDDAWAYARRWLIGPDKMIERSVALLDQPWPQYAICYPKGLELVRRFVDGDPNRFARLLREDLTPADLAA